MDGRSVAVTRLLLRHGTDMTKIVPIACRVSFVTAILSALLATTAFAYCSNGCPCCRCPNGPAQCLDGYASCEEACGLTGGGGGFIDYGAMQRAAEEARKRAEYDKLVGDAQGEIGRQNFKKAVELLEKAIELVPSNRAALKQLLDETVAAMLEQERQEEERRHAAAEQEAIQEVLSTMGELRQTPQGRTNPPGFQGSDTTASRGVPPGFSPPGDNTATRTDSRLLITPEMYKAAVAELSRLKSKRAAFHRQLSRVRQWDQGLRRDDREFEAMREEAQRDLIYEFIDHTPVGSGLEKFAEHGHITTAAKAKIEAGWEASKGLIYHVRGLKAKERSEQVDRIVSGNIALRRAMAAIPLESYPEPARRWLNGFGKAYDATLKLITGGIKDGKLVEKCANTFVDVGEAIVPEAGLPILAQHGAIRGVTYWSAYKAQQSLREALNRNWDAQRYLSYRMDELDSKISKNERLVNGYLAVHGVSKKSRR